MIGAKIQEPTTGWNSSLTPQTASVLSERRAQVEKKATRWAAQLQGGFADEEHGLDLGPCLAKVSELVSSREIAIVSRSVMANHCNPLHRSIPYQKSRDLPERDPRSTLDREAMRPSADRGECDRAVAV